MLFEMKMVCVSAQAGQRALQVGDAGDSPGPFLDKPDPTAHSCWLRPHLPGLLAAGDEVDPWPGDHETARNAQRGVIPAPSLQHGAVPRGISLSSLKIVAHASGSGARSKGWRR